MEVGATRGILWSLVSLLRDDRVTHVACAFDHVIESFRNDLYPGYKTSEGVPDDLMAQFPLAERATHALGLVTWPMVEFEADDALATAAVRWGDAPDVEQVLICTPDKDMTQCVRDGRIVCFDRMRRKMIDEAAVIQKFGVPPASIADWLALVGDSADGYPGVPRWGAKSAAAVLAHYGHLEAIPAQRTPVERERQRCGCPRRITSRASRRRLPLSSSCDAADRCAAHRNARRPSLAGREHARAQGSLSRARQRRHHRSRTALARRVGPVPSPRAYRLAAAHDESGAGL